MAFRTLVSLTPDGELRRPESDEPIAWKCEGCRKWMAPSIPAHVILVDDIGPLRQGRLGVSGCGRFLRRMVVDSACKRSIGGG